MKQWILTFLLKTLPTILWYKLLSYAGRASALNGLPKEKSPRVYDLVNAGPRHRFAVVGTTGQAFLAHNCVQSGGHDLLVISTQVVSELLTEAGIPYWPHVWDMHDALMFMVRDEDVPRALELLRAPFHDRFYRIINPDGQSLCLPKWEPAAVKTWAEDKEEEPGSVQAFRDLYLRKTRKA
jgi:hypothetical protein